MRIITLETLKTMSNGTVFSEINKWGKLNGNTFILTGRTKGKERFVKEINLCPQVAENNERDRHDMLFDKDANMIIDRDIPTKYMTKDAKVHFYVKNHLFVTFSKAEID